MVGKGLCLECIFGSLINILTFRYKGNVECTVEYIYKKCKKLNIKCPAFNLKNKRNCDKGDYLEVNGEK